LTAILHLTNRTLLFLPLSFSDNFYAQYRYRGIRNSESVAEYYSPRSFDQHALLAGYSDSYFDRLKLKLWIGPISQNDGQTVSIGVLEDIRITWRLNEHWLLGVCRP
jgi:hypothetical protein